MQLVTKKKATTELFEKIIMFFYICERMPSSLNKTMLWHESPIYERYMDKRESLFYSNMKPEIKKREWDFFFVTSFPWDNHGWAAKTSTSCKASSLYKIFPSKKLKLATMLKSNQS